MTGYLAKIRPTERARLIAIDHELFMLRDRVRKLTRTRRKLIARAGCRVTYERLGSGYWAERRQERSAADA